MKHLRENFTDEEFEALKEAKFETTFKNWHDFLMSLAPDYLPPKKEEKTK